VNFFKMLEMIQQRPGLYLSSPSVLHLDSYLQGYFVAKFEIGEVEPSQEEVEFYDFQKWIRDKFNITSNQSWSQIIFFYSVNEQNSLDLFFELLEEFKGIRENDRSRE